MTYTEFLEKYKTTFNPILGPLAGNGYYPKNTEVAALAYYVALANDLNVDLYGSQLESNYNGMRYAFIERYKGKVRDELAKFQANPPEGSGENKTGYRPGTPSTNDKRSDTQPDTDNDKKTTAGNGMWFGLGLLALIGIAMKKLNLKKQTS